MTTPDETPGPVWSTDDEGNVIVNGYVAYLDHDRLVLPGGGASASLRALYELLRSHEAVVAERDEAAAEVERLRSVAPPSAPDPDPTGVLADLLDDLHSGRYYDAEDRIERALATPIPQETAQGQYPYPFDCVSADPSCDCDPCEAARTSAPDGHTVEVDRLGHVVFDGPHDYSVHKSVGRIYVPDRVDREHAVNILRARLAAPAAHPDTTEQLTGYGLADRLDGGEKYQVLFGEGGDRTWVDASRDTDEGPVTATWWRENIGQIAMTVRRVAGWSPAGLAAYESPAREIAAGECSTCDGRGVVHDGGPTPNPEPCPECGPEPEPERWDGLLAGDGGDTYTAFHEANPHEGPRQPQPDDNPLADVWPNVKGRCPSCGNESLFLGDGGYLTCDIIDGCSDLTAASKLLATPTSPPGLSLGPVDEDRRQTWYGALRDVPDGGEWEIRLFADGEWQRFHRRGNFDADRIAQCRSPLTLPTPESTDPETEIKVGDRVRSFGKLGTVEAVAADALWVRFDSGSHLTCSPGDVVLVEDEQ